MKLTETKTTFTLTGTAQCQSCGGTGLYVGMCERNGAAVVCHNCNGTGEVKVSQTYKKFNGRVKKNKVKRVFDSACGYVLSADDVTTKEGVTIRFSHAGCTYEEWLNGATPKPMMDLVCPYQHTGQNLQSKDVNGLYKCRCSENLGWGGLITDCKCYKNKKKCWDIYNGITKA